MTLYETQKDREYMVEGLYVEEAVTRRLQALGLNDGTRIRVLNLSTVTPGQLATFSLDPVRALNNVVFPQLGLPTHAT